MVTESIFNGKTNIIPMADVQNIEKRDVVGCLQIIVITKHTKWNFINDTWENAIYLIDFENTDTGYKSTEATDFIKAWCVFRSELELLNN